MHKYLVLIFGLFIIFAAQSGIHGTNITQNEVDKCFTAIRYAREGALEPEFTEKWGDLTNYRTERFKIDTCSVFGGDVSVTKRDEYGLLIDDLNGMVTVAMPGANLAKDLGVLLSGTQDLQTEWRQDDRFHHQTISGTSVTGKGGCQLGYWKMYLTCSDQIRAFVDRAFKRDLIVEEKILITGHSLGGALAQLAAADLKTHFYRQTRNIRLVTFGSPRVYNKVSANIFDEKHIGKPNHLRFITTYTEGALGATTRNIVNALTFRWREIDRERKVRKDHFADATDAPGFNWSFASVRKHYQHTGTEVLLDTEYTGEIEAVLAHILNGYSKALKLRGLID